ncbi:hypothetical protein EVAR_81920_1 [Eumeta japonica]|uniref:Endonuclease/exonuclease/phosphatase domain-containing protein n=1 Tax=Eumeta variegata TaxID=151549 RepID=A0A4C1UXP5_EUMVA|nr:hypothetical protein EVAR_81920_1 [Eumeta japonica]
MEATGCRLATTSQGTIVIVSAYLPATKQLIRSETLLALGNAVILYGDFNCKSPRTVVAKNVREVPASSDHRKLPANVFESSSHSGGRNENWSDLMEKITTIHKAFWRLTKALKSEGYTPIPPLKRPDGITAIDDAETVEFTVDSIEF